MKTDLAVFCIIEILLGVLFATALLNDLWNWQKAKSASVTVTVKRGEKNMNAIYVFFGVTTVVFTLIVQTCKALEGNQVLYIVLNYTSLAYLFFYSTWFRDRQFFPLLRRIRED
jgi:hypothetical protein